MNEDVAYILNYLQISYRYDNVGISTYLDLVRNGIVPVLRKVGNGEWENIHKQSLLDRILRLRC